MADSRAALRREQVRLLLVAVPVLVTTYLLLDGLGAVSDSKLIALLALLPLAAVLVALGLPLVRERRLVLGGGFLRFSRRIACSSRWGRAPARSREAHRRHRLRRRHAL